MSKSDVEAKEAFVAELEARGYEEVRVVRGPADIVAERDGEQYYFEVKWTSKRGVYFGAATITEWEAALRWRDRYRFVVARRLDDSWRFREFTPDEFLAFSEVPPFKIYFRVPADPQVPESRNRQSAVPLTEELVAEMAAFRQRMVDALVGEPATSDANQQ